MGIKLNEVQHHIVELCEDNEAMVNAIENYFDCIGQCGFCNIILDIGRGDQFAWNKYVNQWHCISCQRGHNVEGYE